MSAVKGHIRYCAGCAEPFCTSCNPLFWCSNCDDRYCDQCLPEHEAASPECAFINREEAKTAAREE